MKRFEVPEIEVQKFEIADILTTSGIENEDNMTDKG